MYMGGRDLADEYGGSYGYLSYYYYSGDIAFLPTPFQTVCNSSTPPNGTFSPYSGGPFGAGGSGNLVVHGYTNGTWHFTTNLQYVVAQGRTCTNVTLVATNYLGITINGTPWKVPVCSTLP
jgi:hypothetical protein